MVDLREANERVALFEQFKFEDDQPNLEAAPLSVLYDSYVDYNFADRGAFDSRWTDETHAIAQLRDALKQGDQFINLLYTYRSCSKALPQVKTADQPNKNEIYEGTYAVLEPEIKKLKTFMYFQRDTIKLFCDHVKRLTTFFVLDKKKANDSLPSESYLAVMAQLLDRFALLDALKNMKACLNNDFSFYKRAFGFLRRNMSGNDDQTQENHTLYLFLAHQNSITTNLKTEIEQIAGYEEVLAAIVNQCADYLEADRHLLPQEKHCLIRVIPYGLYLIDIVKSKRIKPTRFVPIFKKYPIVPLYGDMQITLEAFIKKSANYDEKSWGITGIDAKLSFDYEIINHVDTVRQLHNDYLSRFATMINEVKVMMKQTKQIDYNVAKEVYSIVLQGLQFLSDWTSKVLQQTAWKYARPNTDPALENTVEYERVVRYNYKPEEKVALVEFVAMIKGLAAVMIKEDSLLSPIIRNCIHDEVQDYIQVQLRDLIRHTTKKKKKELRNDLLQLRFIGADWYGGTEPADPALQGKKSEKNEKIQIPSRAVGPSPTQLELLRNITFGLITKKKELSSKHEKVLDDFYARSFYYQYLLNYTDTLLKITDLGDLWYREFYLELSKRLQFPIDMSLPWILTDNILESKEASISEYVLYPLDLYNDAANRALSSLKQQFLYDEIEAEVNLCFDQLIFKLSEQVYAYFKTQAASILMDKSYKAQLEAIFSAHRLHVPRSRYDVLLKQRHVQLLGRSIDLNNLIAQRMNTYLRQNIDYAIGRFEASDLAGVVELERLLLNIRMTHQLMSKFFHLDPWDSVLNEMNESTALISFHGRIVLHIIFEIVYDFAPNFCFNSISNRFIRRNFSQEPPRDAMPRTNISFLYGSKVLTQAYQNSDELHKKFVGGPHVTSIVNLLGKSHMPLVVSECLQNIDLKIRNVLLPYVRELMGGMPQSSKLPIHDYGTEGGFGYFQLKLKEIITYPDLRPEVLQNFREFGNILALLKLLDAAVAQFDLAATILAAPFLGITAEKINEADPTTSAPLYVGIQSVATLLEGKPGVASAPIILRDLVNSAWKADKFYRPSNQNITLFKSIMQKISIILESVRGEWSGTPADNGVIAVDFTTEFYRLWSALQFVCCLPSNDTEPSDIEIFGDGLMWAGCTIIHFLGQRDRFEVFDFCYHILNVEESAPAQCSNPSIHNFFEKVRLIRDLNQTIFNSLASYVAPPKEDLVLFHPPKIDVAQSEHFIAPGADTGTLRPGASSNSVTSFNNVATTTSMPPPPPPDDDGFAAPPPPPDDDSFADEGTDIPDRKSVV